MVHDASNGDQYALKAFPIVEKDKVNPLYMNEKRFVGFSHINVVFAVQTVDFRDVSRKSSTTKISYILYELAPYGDIGQLYFK